MTPTPDSITRDPSAPGRALTIERYFTTAGEHPFDAVEWELRDARIGHGDRVAFEQRDVEFPKSWSQNATNIVAQKYFRGQVGSPEREHSVKEMVSRVAGTITGFAAAMTVMVAGSQQLAIGWLDRALHGLAEAEAAQDGDDAP